MMFVPMMFVHCPACATPVREGRVFCTDCGADMPHPDLVAIYNGRSPKGGKRRPLRLRMTLVAALLRAH
jgi:uncharacterized Zn finger protein (UPF0148 family)